MRTATADSDRELAERAKVAKALGADLFLAAPYRSRERGLNGHTEGPPPRCLPKGTDPRQVTDARVKRVRDILNARPRRVLVHLAPAETRARPPRGAPPRRTAGTGRFSSASVRGALRPQGGPVTLRFKGTAAAFRVESGPLAGKTFNPGPKCLPRPVQPFARSQRKF